MGDPNAEDVQAADGVAGGRGARGSDREGLLARRRGRRRADLDWRRALLGYLILLVVAFVAGADLSARIQANAARSIARDQRQIDGSCHRLNIVRANDNRNSLADFRFYLLEIRLIQASLHDKTALDVVLRRALHGLRAIARAKAWIALTDCKADLRGNYPIASPRFFWRALPPRSALLDPG